MTNDFLDRVAKAICKADGYPDEYWPDYLIQAREAAGVVFDECLFLTSDMPDTYHLLYAAKKEYLK